MTVAFFYLRFIFLPSLFPTSPHFRPRFTIVISPRVMFHCVMIFLEFTLAGWSRLSVSFFVCSLSSSPYLTSILFPLVYSLRISNRTLSYRTGRIDWRSTDFCASSSKKKVRPRPFQHYPVPSHLCSSSSSHLPPVNYVGPTFARCPILSCPPPCLSPTSPQMCRLDIPNKKKILFKDWIFPSCLPFLSTPISFDTPPCLTTCTDTSAAKSLLARARHRAHPPF